MRRLNKGSVSAREAAASASLREAAPASEAAPFNDIGEAVPAGVAAPVSQATGMLRKLRLPGP